MSHGNSKRDSSRGEKKKEKVYEVAEIKEVPVDKIDPIPGNVRQMTDEQFNMLVDSILENKFNEPIKVVKYGDRYRIVDGQHRFEALTKVFGVDKVLVTIIGEEWSEERYWAEVIRLNNVKGDWNFSALVDRYMWLKEKYGLDDEELRRSLGFKRGDAVFKRLVKQVERSLPPEIASKFKEKKKENKTADELLAVVRELMAKYGKTAKHSYLIFAFGGKEHVLISATPKLMRQVKAVIEAANAKGLDVAKVMEKLIKPELV